jgi:hypothetical protein
MCTCHIKLHIFLILHIRPNLVTVAHTTKKFGRPHLDQLYVEDIMYVPTSPTFVNW